MDEITIEFNPSAFKHGITEEDIRTAIEQFVYNETIMAKMTNEEAGIPDKYYTENTIMPVRGKPGLFAERKIRMFAVDALSAQYFTAKAAAEHKTTMEIIGELVREKIAATE